ncbi:MAG: ABC transporter permease, partial [Deltaproteobacteria bacterium]
MIEIKNIQKTYTMGSVEVKALDGVSLKVEAGEFIAIVGPSGSGKSTMMHILGLLDRADAGTYSLRHKEVTGLSDDELASVRNGQIGFVFQQFHLLPRMSALENVELPLIYAGKRHLVEKARHELEEVGLGQRMRHRPSEMSGGQQQRVAIARALVNDPPIIMADEPTGNLDSKSKNEIMNILEGLNARGKTVIIVTHEKEIADRCRRIITMRDGKIISDERLNKVKQPAAVPVKNGNGNGGAVVEQLAKTPKKVTGGMKFLDYVREATFSMISHKMRAILSILGILIGVAAVIAMLALGTGAKMSIEKQLSSLGSNLLMIMPGSPKSGPVAMEAGTVTRFTFSDLNAITALESVSRGYGSVQGRGQMVYGAKNWNTQVQGVGVDFAEMRASVPETGRFFTEAEFRGREKVIVLGATVARELFGDSNPVGETVKLNLNNFKVVGVLPTKGASGWH